MNRRAHKTCPECNEDFYPRSRSSQVCCSRSCGMKLSRRRRGLKPEPHVWGLKHKGEDSCRCCGLRAQHLHHIVPRSRAPHARWDIHGNGLPLCTSCHLGWHARAVTIYRECLLPDEVKAALNRAGQVWLDRNYPLRNIEEQIDLVDESGGIEAAYGQIRHVPDYDSPF